MKVTRSVLPTLIVLPFADFCSGLKRGVEDPQNVYFPDSPSNTFVNGHGVVVEAWPIIQTELNKLINAVNAGQFHPGHFDNVIHDYTPTSHLGWTAIKSLLHLSDYYTKQLPDIARLALQIPQVISNRPLLLLKKGQFASLTLTQQEIAVLLANSFFCTYPKREKPFREFQSYPSANFFRLFEGTSESNVEKLKCYFNYFNEMSHREGPGSKLTFERRTLTATETPEWKSSAKPLSNTVVSSSGTIEENGVGMLQVDFANKFIGGGILGNGMTQEEIRFSINPELTAALLFTEFLSDNEVLVITGSEQFNRYTGYGSTFKYGGKYLDTTPLDGKGRRQTQILAMDALRFKPSAKHEQFYLQNLNRELNKAYCGFMLRSPGAFRTPIATGKWGAGVFNGDPTYKFLVQLLAASQAGRDMYMFTFGDETEANEMSALYAYLKRRGISVSKLHSVLEAYSNATFKDGAKVESVTSFIRKHV